MKLASNMLLQEDKSISEIAAAVGYKSQSKFPSSSLDYLLFFASASKTAFVNGLVVLSAKDAASYLSL